MERLRKRLIDQRLRASELGFLSKSAPEIICKISSRHFFPECMQRNLNKPTIQKWNNFDLTTHSLSKSNLEINIAGKIPRQSHDYCELLKLKKRIPHSPPGRKTSDFQLILLVRAQIQSPRAIGRALSQSLKCTFS